MLTAGGEGLGLGGAGFLDLDWVIASFSSPPCCVVSFAGSEGRSSLFLPSSSLMSVHVGGVQSGRSNRVPAGGVGATSSA
jgi:hypothetical protein